VALAQLLELLEGERVDGTHDPQLALQLADTGLGRGGVGQLGALGGHGHVGLDLQIPGFSVAGVNLYYRYDEYAGNTWQISPFWTVPFSVGPVPVVFTGFVDVNGTKYGAANKKGVEIWAQPELLVDVLAPFGGKTGKLHAGVEWYYHSGYAFGETKTTATSAPQAMVQWTVF